MSDVCSSAGISKDSCQGVAQPETVTESHLLLLKSKKYCDVIFTFPNAPDIIEAHEIFLKARSPVFAKTFQSRTSSNVRSNEIEISETTPARFQEFLEFIYADKFQVHITGAFELLHLAQKYEVQPLIKKCEHLLKSQIQVKDSVKLFETARRYGYQEIMNAAGEIMARSFVDLAQIGALANAEEETLIFLLGRDDLNVEEVKLFGFILEWGKNQAGPSADEKRFKSKLQNVILKIRYTNMTMFEFTKVVVPTGLLSADETLSVYSYIAGDEKTRKDSKTKFNSTLRKVERVEKLVDFYVGRKSFYSGSSALSKQHLTFKPERARVVTTAARGYFVKMAAIMGIKFQWPLLAESYSERGFIMDFHVSIREYSGPGGDGSFTLKYQKKLFNCKTGVEEDIAVEPPVQFKNGSTYSVVIEDQSTTNLNDRYASDNMVYRGLCTLDPMQEAIVDLEGSRLTFTQIQRKNEFALNAQERSEKYPKITVIRGMVIGLV